MFSLNRIFDPLAAWTQTKCFNCFQKFNPNGYTLINKKIRSGQKDLNKNNK